MDGKRFAVIAFHILAVCCWSGAVLLIWTTVLYQQYIYTSDDPAVSYLRRWGVAVYLV